VRVWVTLAVSALFALAPSAVHAQPSDPRTRDAGFIGKEVPILEIDECPANPPLPPDELRRVGSEHFERGEVLYVQGDYSGAVIELVAAYCIQPYYTILKDVGQAYERELDYEKAIAYFEKYVLAVPKDAQRTGPCAPDPQVDRDNVAARIKVLQNLRAKVRVNTDPAGAKITLVDYQGVVAARGGTGDELAVLGGHYQVFVEREGYRTEQSEIDVGIGKPYTIFSTLQPRKGKLRVRTVPYDARLFLKYPSGDTVAIGTGSYETELPSGKYKVSAEASGYLTASREIDILADRDTPIALDLPPEPQFGRRQLIAYATAAGSFAAGSIAAATENNPLIVGGAGAGLVAGFFGSYFAAPRDIPLGTSSLTITSSLVGATLLYNSASLFTDRNEIRFPALGLGLIGGGAVGAFTGTRLHIKPGDAAVINSGAVWGTATGILFAGSFDADRKVTSGLVLSGLGMGTLGGVLVTRYFEVSRARAALIDVGGVVGIFIGLGIEGVVSAQTNANGSKTESQTNYTLGGMITGLLIAGVLTRNMDAPQVNVAPTVSKTQGGTTMLGVGGAF